MTASTSDPDGRAAAFGATPEALRLALREVDYLIDEAFATVVFLALAMGRPLFLEGEPGSGKTELAKALAQVGGGELHRVQCYEGIESTQALYEWDYGRQLVHLRVLSERGDLEAIDESELYSERFLIERPLLRALRAESNAPRPVLLIDEVDRADDEFEAFLLEALSDYAVTVPEFGTVRAENRPVVVLTSNRTRDVHDALKRRSLYHWLEPPSFEREVEIVRARVPEISTELAAEVARAVQYLRGLSLYKPPGVAETIDWAKAFVSLGRASIDSAGIEATLGLVVKYREDLDQIRSTGIERILERARQ